VKQLGLSTRLTLAMVLLLLVAQVVMLVAFVRAQQEAGGAWRAPVPTRIAAAAEALDRTPSRERDALLVAMNGDSTRFFIANGTPAGYREGRGLIPDLYEDHAGALRGRDPKVLVPEVRRQYRPALAGRRTAAYAFSVALADGQRLVVAPGVGQRRRSIAAAILILNLLVCFTAAFLAWRTIRGATRGLEAIALASDRFAEDLSAPPMEAGGSAEARQMAAAFNRMRGEIRRLMRERMTMLAAAAHDLKTLLTRLRLRVGLIDDPDQRAAGDRDIALMASLIEDVLIVARGEERPPVLGPVDVAALLREIVADRQAQGQAVTAGRIDDGPVTADVAALRRIVENLIENAVTYAGSAEVEFARDVVGWRLRVIDHGPGLRPEFAPRAFEPFARGEESRSRATGGAGLGLAICRSLAAQMKMTLSLERTPSGGLTVCLSDRQAS
jgi:signal transduction histidine kinase